MAGRKQAATHLVVHSYGAITTEGGKESILKITYKMCTTYHYARKERVTHTSPCLLLNTGTLLRNKEFKVTILLVIILHFGIGVQMGLETTNKAVKYSQRGKVIV